MPRHPVDDPEHPMVRSFLGLRDHHRRREREQPGGDMAGVFMAEGDLVIERGLAAGLALQAVLVDAAGGSGLRVPDEVDVIEAGPRLLREVCGRPRLRDPIARFARPALALPARLLRDAATVVVTERVTNANNMGVVARSAAALGADALLVDPSSCDPLYRRAVRASMGQIFAVAHTRIPELPGGLGELHGAGFEMLALTPSADAVDIGDLEVGPSDRIALVIGAEGPGISPPTMAACDQRVRIPMSAGVDSLNVGVAAGVACFAIGSARARHRAGEARAQ